MSRKALVFVSQIIISVFGAFYIVRHSVSYVGFGPPGPWWDHILTWLAALIMGMTDFHLKTVLLILLIAYSGMIFLVLHYVFMKPVRRRFLHRPML